MKIYRCDGLGFSSLTKKYFERPYDSEFAKKMNNAARNVFLLTSRFRPNFALIGSDEISFFFKNPEESFSGREEKFLSILAATVTDGFEKKGFLFDCKNVTNEMEYYIPRRIRSLQNNFVNDMIYFYNKKMFHDPYNKKVQWLISNEIPFSRPISIMYWREISFIGTNKATGKSLNYTRNRLIEELITNNSDYILDQFNNSIKDG